MAGIIDTATTKNAGSPLIPLDKGDFEDPTLDPTTGQPVSKPKPVPQESATGAGNTPDTTTGSPTDATGGTTDPTLPPAQDDGTNPLNGQMPNATIPNESGGNQLNGQPPNAPGTQGTTQSPGNALQSTIQGKLGGTTPAGSPPPPSAGGAPADGGGGSPGGSTTYDTSGQHTQGTGNTSTSWTPTSGIIDQVQGMTPGTVEGQGYTATTMGDTPAATAEGYTATGYTAAQGTAETSNENVSSAVDRITGADSPIEQRARAQAQDEANARGLGNSTMAVQAGQAAVLDKAITIAQGDVQNAQFNAAEKNAMTISNVHEANAAAAFHAQATNDAAAFSAAAKNQASQFNSGQAQQKMEFAAQQWDAAAAFSAQAKQAAATFNVSEYDKAMQSYVDAKNAATAAQNDAVNLSRRDTAQINAGLEQARIGAAATVGAAQAHAGGMVAAAQIGAASSAANLQASISAQRDLQANSLNEDMTKYNLGLNQQQQQWASNLSASQFNTFQSGYTAISTSQLEPDAKQNALQNYMQLWTASGTLPFDIHVPGSP